MRSLTETLLEKQKLCDGTPLVKLEAQTFGYPSSTGGEAITGLEMFKLHDGGTEYTDSQHGVALGNDGSLNRVYIGTDNKLYHQRIATPTTESDYSTWTILETGLTYNCVAIASNPATTEMLIVCEKGIKVSTDNGATWGSWTQTGIWGSYTLYAHVPPAFGRVGTYISLAYKPNGDCALVADGMLGWGGRFYLAIKKRISGSWGNWYEFGVGEDGNIWCGLAMYFDTDWNIIVLTMVTEVTYIYAVIFDDITNIWDYIEEISFTDTKIITPETINLETVSWRTPSPETVSPLLFLSGGKVTQSSLDEATRSLARIKHVSRIFADVTHNPTLNIHQIAHPTTILCAQVFIVKSYSGVIMALFHDGNSYFYLLKPGTTFEEGLFADARVLANTATFGMALAADDTWIYACQPSEVWRAPSHYLWEVPSAGTGAGDKITINQADIISITEQVRDGEASGQLFILDNSSGQYATIGTGDLTPLNLGSRINVFIGYNTASGDEYSESARYFLENYQFFREAGISRLALLCVNAWAKLDKYIFTSTVEWNVHYDQYTIYEMVDFLVQAIGGTLSYESRSSLITSLTPAIYIRPGGTAGDAMKQLFEYVPDVIRFFGADATISYPQASDESTYSYAFTS
jgi:hypothetical protein